MLRSENVAKYLFVFLAIGAVFGGVIAKPPKRIWDGRLATDDEFGAMITLSNPEQSIHTCGGGIIGPRHILTAGHCVNNLTSADLGVRAGIHDIRDFKNVVFRLVKEIVLHPDFIAQNNKQQGRNDVAILVLEEPLPIGGRIHKLMLPTHEPQKGNTYTLAGFGRNHYFPTSVQYELKVLNMTLSDANRCQGFAPQTICITSDSGAACPGDSGSPLVQDGYLYGIASASWCLIGNPSIFVNVFNYVNWIKDIMRQNP